MAVSEDKIFQLCPQCKGSGEMSVTQTTPEPDDPEPDVTATICNQCDGEGYIELGYLEATGINDQLNDIMDKVNDIFEKVNE